MTTPKAPPLDVVREWATHEPTIIRAIEQRGALARAYLALRESSPDDLRERGWSVAVHNDYRLDGEPHTFWLLTRGDRCIKGEGRTDAEALRECRRLAALLPEEDDHDRSR